MQGGKKLAVTVIREPENPFSPGGYLLVELGVIHRETECEDSAFISARPWRAVQPPGYLGLRNGFNGMLTKVARPF